MTTLITGAFGFVGTNLSKFLAKSSPDTLLALDIGGYEQYQFDEFYTWNDLDSINWDTVDTIIHLAGKAHDTSNTSDEKSYFDINLGLTRKIFGYFLESKAKKFIFFSSVKAVADSVNGEFLDEADTPSPATPYGKSKLAAEKYLTETVEAFNKEPRDKNEKELYILRPCMIHGPGNKGNLNLLYKVVQKGIPWPLGIFDNQRSMVSIDNLTYIIGRIISEDIRPGTYQVADDQPLSTNQIIQLMAISLGRKPVIWNVPARLVRGIAKVGDFLPFPLNSERLKKLTESYRVSNQKIKTALGISHLPVNAREGLTRTLDGLA